MVIGAAANEIKAALNQRLAQNSSVCLDLLGIDLPLGA